MNFESTMGASDRLILRCPGCGNDSSALMDKLEHRREQMSMYCIVCSKTWVVKFANLPKEAIIPPELKKDDKERA